MSDVTLEALAEVRTVRDRLAAAEIASLYRAFRGDAPAVKDPAMGEKFVYAEVAALTVQLEVRRAAERAVRWAVDDNLLEYRPELLWFVPETDADRAHVARYGCREWRWGAFKRPVYGWSIQQLGEVWLSAGLDVAGAVNTAAHEVRHLAQDQNDMDRYTAELDAKHYATRVEGRIHGYLAA